MLQSAPKPHDNGKQPGAAEDAMHTTASDLAALDAALARDAQAQARAERRATCKPGFQLAPAARFARALAMVGEGPL